MASYKNVYSDLIIFIISIIMRKLRAYWPIIVLLFMIMSAFGCRPRNNDDNRELTEAVRLMKLQRFKELDSVADIILSHEHLNSRMEAWGNYFKGIALLFHTNDSIAHQYLTRAWELGIQLKNDSIVALALNNLGIYEITNNLNHAEAQQYFFLSYQHADDSGFEDLKQYVACNLAQLGMIENDISGINYSETALSYGTRHSNPSLQVLGAIQCALFHKMQGNYNEATKYIEIAETVCPENDKHSQAKIHLIRASIFTDLNDFSKAQAQLVEAKHKGAEEQVFEHVNFLIQSGKLNLKQHKISLAISNLEKAQELVDSDKLLRSKIEINRYLADAYDAANCPELRDSAKNQFKLLNERNTLMEKERLSTGRALLYELMKKENLFKEEHKKVYQRNIIALILGVFLLVAIFVTIVLRRNYTKIQNLYRKIVEKSITRVSEGIPTAVGFSDNMEGETDAELEHGTEEENGLTVKDGQELYQRAVALMQEEQYFKDLQCSLEGMAERLGTNRTYLSSAIKKYGGLTVPKFICQFRINEAVKLLSDPAYRDVPQRKIGEMVGYTNLSTYHKLFTTMIGVTPAVFRKKALEIDGV